VPAAPAASRAKWVERTRVSSPRGPPESPGIPARNGFNGLFRALPGDRAFLSPSSREWGWSAPGRADFASARLDAGVEASGPHDFAVRSNIVRQRSADRSQAHANPPCHHLRARRCRVHRIPPRVRDDRDTPLEWGGTATDMEVIWPGCEPEYFCKGDWTAQISRRSGTFNSRLGAALVNGFRVQCLAAPVQLSALSCLDGAPCQGCLAVLRTSRVRSCLRPVCAGVETRWP
jgi:hypothetical protein